MRDKTEYHVPCRITRSGFSSERVFRLDQADGSEYVGAAPVDYFFTTTHKSLPANSPKQKGEEVDGYVAARVLQERDDGVLISIPSGDVILVREDAVQDKKGNRRVPAQP